MKVRIIMKVKISELLYKIILSLLMFDAAFYNTTLPIVFKDKFHMICLILMLIFSIFCIFSKKYTIKYLLLNILILMFGLISYLISGNSDIFISLLLVMLAWNINLDEILKIIFNVRFIVFILVVSLSLIGILDVGTIATTSADKGVLLGYGHANTFAGSAGILIFLMFAIKRNNIKHIHYYIALIADILIFYFSRSRTSLMLISLLIVIVYMVKNSSLINNWVLKISKYILPLILISIFTFIFIRTKGIAPHFIDIIDKIMNGRILLACMNLMYYPITLLGQRIDMSLIATSNTYFALDNGYIYILIHYGVIGLLVICILQQYAITRCINESETILCVISTLILCWMMYEGMMVSATANFTLLFSVVTIKKYNNIKTQKGINL